MAAATQPADALPSCLGGRSNGVLDEGQKAPNPSIADIFPAVVQDTCAAAGSYYRRTLLDALSSIEGHKLFLLEESLASAVSSLVDAAVLQQHGVERCFALGAFPLTAASVPSQTALAPTVLVLCRPRLSRLPLIVRHLSYIEDSYPPAQAPTGAPSSVGASPLEADESLWTLPLPPIASKSNRRYVVVFVPTPSDFLAGELRRLLSSCAQQKADSSGQDSPLLPAAAASLLFNLSSTLLPRGDVASEAGGGGSSSVSPDSVVVTHCPLRFFPLEKDVLSLEFPNFLRAFHGQGDPTTCKQVAEAVVVLQEDLQQGILVPNLRCIGSAAKYIADHLIRRRREQQRLQMEEASVGGNLVPAASGAGMPADLVPPVHGVLDASDLEEAQLPTASSGQGGMGRVSPGRMNTAAVLPHQIDMLVLFDRRADLVTPLCTPFTYEGLLDNIVGIDGSGLDVPKQLLQQQQQQQQGEPGAAQRLDVAGLSGQAADILMVERGKTQRVSLAGDALYALLRDLHQSEVGATLHRVASDIQQTYREKESLRTIADISSFMPKFKSKQQEHSSLSLHVKLASFVSAVAKSPAYHRRLCVEDQLLQTGGTGSSGAFDAATVGEFEDLIDESAATEAAASAGLCSAAAATLDEVYRLLCLASVVNGGIKPKHLEPLLHSIVQQHGLPELRRIAALHKVGLLREQLSVHTGKAGASGMGVQRWKYVREKCRLMVDEQQAMTDIAYACSGYAPLSIRLLQLLHETSLGWRAIPDVLNSLWGPAMEIRQQQTMPKAMLKPDQHVLSPGACAPTGAARAQQRGSSNSPTLVVILFLGGVSHAEIAAVRRLNEMERKKTSEAERGFADRRQYLILTTEILTPRKLFKSMLDAVD
ncbi:hypothetical protein Esti_004067 [Eimeria stiedai]